MLLLASTLAAAGLAACGSASTPPAAKSPKTVAHEQPVSNTEFGPDALASLFPRDGQDLAQAVAMQAFIFSVDQKQESQCLAKVGFPPAGVSLAQEAVGQGAYGTDAMPNLPLIERTQTVGNNVGYHTPPNPSDSMKASERKAYVAMSKKCAGKVFTFARVLDTGNALALVREWNNITSQVFASEAITKQNQRGASCSKGTAFPAASVELIVQKIGGSIFHYSPGSPRARAAQAAGVRVLKRCFASEINLQAKILTAKRAEFFSENATAVHQLVTRVNAAVDHLEGAGVAPKSVLTVAS